MDDIRIQARKKALSLLEYKDRTTKELRQKLLEKGYAEDVVEDAIAYAASFHYVDDERYAANYVRYQQNNKSRLQLQMDLQARGISKEGIASALEEEHHVEPEALIMRWLSKKHFDPSTADEKERRRVYQFLLRKGFRSGEILRCMKMEEEF